jgi:hypothetical protein
MYQGYTRIGEGNECLPLTSLQSRRYPDVEYADVDNSDDYGSADHYLFRSTTVRNDDSDAVDDNLQKKLNLDAPKEHYYRLVCMHLTQSSRILRIIVGLHMEK